MPQKPEIKHVLLIRLSAMGDVAIVPNIIIPLVEAYPSLKVTVVSFSLYSPIFENLSNTHFYAADLYGKHKGLLGIYRLANELKALNVDVVADLHDVIRSKILRFFLSLKGIKIAHIDKGRAEKKALTKADKKRFEPLKTTRERYADVLRALGLPLKLRNKGTVAKRVFPSDIISKEKTNIGIAPFAAYPSKTYPIEKMELVIKALSAPPKNVVLLFGGKEHIEVLEKLQRKYPKVKSLAGHYSFARELEVISNLDVMLSMDSANAHLAAMYNVPVVTLWGVTHPYAGFGAIGKHNIDLLPNRLKYPLIPTSVYGNKCPKDYLDAIASITPKSVIDEVLQLLDSEV